MTKGGKVMANLKTQKKRNKKANGVPQTHSNKGSNYYPVNGGKVMSQTKAQNYHNKIG